MILDGACGEFFFTHFPNHVLLVLMGQGVHRNVFAHSLGDGSEVIFVSSYSFVFCGGSGKTGTEIILSTAGF